MPTVTHSTTGAGTSNSWGSPGNAAASDGAYATRAVARRSANTAWWAVPAFTEIPAGSTIDAVTVSVENRASTTSSDPTLTVALAVGTSVVGSATGSFTESTSDHVDTWTVSGASLADLQSGSLQVRTVDNRDSSTSVTLSIDHLAVAVEYTAPVTVPSAPTDVTASAGDAEATVAFTVPTDDGGSLILDYRVTSSPGGITATAAGSPITVSGLANGTDYTFTVAARNAVGYSAESTPSNSVTPAAPPPTEPTYPATYPAQYGGGPYPETYPETYATVTWSLWDGAVEIPLTLDGVWDGAAIMPAAFDVVTS